MDRFLNILEAPRPEETFDEEKIRFINSKILIWDFFCILQANYLAYSNEEKSRMFRDYCQKLVNKYYGNGKIICLYGLICLANFLLFLATCGLIFYWVLFLVNEHGSAHIDSGISQAVKNENKICMTKIFLEMTE